MAKIHCSILTPEKVIFEGDADAVYLMAYDGERGILPGHAPLVAQLGIGIARLYNNGHLSVFEVEGGFAEVSKNRIILLAEEAMRKEELSEKNIRMELDHLNSVPKPTDRAGARKYETRRKKLDSRLKIALK